MEPIWAVGLMTGTVLDTPASYQIVPGTINATSAMSGAISKQGSHPISPGTINATSSMSLGLPLKKGLSPQDHYPAIHLLGM